MKESEGAGSSELFQGIDHHGHDRLILAVSLGEVAEGGKSYIGVSVEKSLLDRVG
jgi:hypothetical protein